VPGAAPPRRARVGRRPPARPVIRTNREDRPEGRPARLRPFRPEVLRAPRSRRPTSSHRTSWVVAGDLTMPQLRWTPRQVGRPSASGIRRRLRQFGTLERSDVGQSCHGTGHRRASNLRSDRKLTRRHALPHTDAPAARFPMLLPPTRGGRPTKTERPQRITRDDSINHHVTDPAHRVADRDKPGCPRAPHSPDQRAHGPPLSRRPLPRLTPRTGTAKRQWTSRRAGTSSST
jgi:hypothetical protein